jgi:hypothetical protein
MSVVAVGSLKLDVASASVFDNDGSSSAKLSSLIVGSIWLRMGSRGAIDEKERWGW